MGLKLNEGACEKHPAIMYVCALCAEGAPEGCGRADPEDIRRAPSGIWMCEYCWYEEQGENDPAFSDLPAAPRAYPSS